MSHQVGPWSSVVSIVEHIRQGKVTATQMTQAALARASRVQADLNCFVEIDQGGALRAAEEVDRMRHVGESLGPLCGVPVAIKDCTPVIGLGNRFGSLAYRDEVAHKDAVVVSRFKRAGAIILGKTALSEMASSSFCDSPLHGVTRNPWAGDRTPGGSSGGSAVALATGCVAVAEGTDMGGSVRIPASCTGVVGIKPAFGRIPNDDQPSFVDDIQHHGLLTRTVEDLCAALPHVCGPDSVDPKSFVTPCPGLQPDADIRGMRVAISPDLGFFVVEGEVAARLREVAVHLENRGATVDTINLEWDRSIADGWVKHWHVYLAAFFGDRLESVSHLIDPRLMTVVRKGRSHDAVSIKKLDLLRARQWAVLQKIFERYDVLLSPTMTRPAVGVEEDDARYHVQTDDGKKRGLDMTSVFNWIPWCPALSIPAGLSADRLPVGVHVTAPPYREDLAIKISAAIQVAYPHQRPPGWADE